MTEQLAPIAGSEADDEELLWPDQQAKRGVRIRIPTIVLGVLLVVAAGIWGGASLQRGHASAASTTSGFTGGGLLAGAGGGAVRGFARSFATATGGAAAGIVTVIEGNVLYVTTASGALTKVLLNTSTAVTRTASTTVAALTPGDTVVVQGTASKSGVVSATSITATAKGVSTTAGAGFAGATAGRTTRVAPGSGATSGAG